MVPSYFLSILSRDTTTITSVRHVTLGGDEDFNELRVGGGVEGKFGNVGVRGEYTYTTYEDPDITGWVFFALGGIASFGFMLGEIPNSFLKRQLGVPPGGAPRGRLARLAAFCADRLDSILGMLLAMSLVVPTPWKMWMFVLVIGPGVHLLFSVALFSLGVKRRWA